MQSVESGLTRRPYRIAQWTVDPLACRITRGGITHKLEPKVAQVLTYLAERQGQVVTRKELENAVWAGTVVGYDAITNTVIKLRKALGDDSRRPTVVETISKVGYRFIAPVEPVEPPMAATKPVPVSRYAMATVCLLILGSLVFGWYVPSAWDDGATLPEVGTMLPQDEPSIAILPFSNMSGDPTQAYFTDGITTDLTTDLSRVAGLFVIAANSALVYKDKAFSPLQVAEELGVRYLLRGSVRRAGNKLRINAQLTDTTTGQQLWAERYDGTLDQVFELQDKVTRNIVAALSMKLTGNGAPRGTTRGTDNPLAYDSFLQGWSQFQLQSPGAFAKAVEHLDVAVSIDHTYARAHALLAAIYWQTWDNGWVDSLGLTFFGTKKKLDHHLKEALEEPTPLAHWVSSQLLSAQTKYDEAVAEAERAIQLDPNAPLGHAASASALVYAGQPQRGIEHIAKAMRLDPYHPPGYLFTLGQAQVFLARYEEAIETLSRAIRRNAENEWPFVYLAAAYGHVGRDAEAVQAVADFNELRHAAGLSELTLSYVDHWRFGSYGHRQQVRAGLTRVLGPLSWRTLVGRDASGHQVRGSTIIDEPAAKAMHERGVLFVDVNPPYEWHTAHIPGAVHIMSLDFSAANLSKIMDKQQEVVIYGVGRWHEGARDAVAKAISLGYQKVHYFRPGIKGWQKAGFGVEVEYQASGKSFDTVIGKWDTRFKQPGGIWKSIPITIASRNEASNSVGEGRIHFDFEHAADVWEGIWVDNTNHVECAVERYGSRNWGRVRLAFNGAYNRFEGSWDQCGTGQGSPWHGAR